MFMLQPRQKGFTLIELLIVVLIIAILAAIATPNLLEYQTRAKVSRVKSELQSLATGLEAYNVDTGEYPPARDPGIGTSGVNIFPLSARLAWITTPISYLSRLPGEMFKPKAACWNGLLDDFDTYDYYDKKSDELENDGMNSTRGAHWRLSSAGPDLFHSFSIIELGGSCMAGVEYDPTNGAVSQGDITRLGPFYVHDTRFNF